LSSSYKSLIGTFRRRTGTSSLGIRLNNVLRKIYAMEESVLHNKSRHFNNGKASLWYALISKVLTLKRGNA